MINNNVYIGFDFSINKPAMTIYYNNLYSLYIWPREIDNKLIEKYKQCDVYVDNRNLSAIKKGVNKETELTMLHTVRSTDLANKIIDTIDDFLLLNKIYQTCNLYICSEGLSFNSMGDATLNLATYKGVLLSKLYEKYNAKIKFLGTYSPLTIKSTAGCAGKEYRGNKNGMIEKFMESDCNHKFRQALSEGIFNAGKSYKQCVDDIVDSYWAIKTMFRLQEIE